jgi:plastocyanin
MINIEGDENPEIFGGDSPEPGADPGHSAEPTQPASGEVHEVSMVPGSSTVQPMEDPSEFADDEDPADYSTNVLVIKAGDTVRFTNQDAGMIHTATAVDGSFDTGFLNEGESADVTFDTPGEYEFYCLPHPWMRARIIVEAG